MLESVRIAPESGSLQNYPFTEFAAYAMPYTREAAGSEYKYGSSQRSLDANVRQRRWRVVHRLSAAELQTMRDFYRTHLEQPFKFFDRINDIACMAVFTGTFQEWWSAGYFSISVELAEVRPQQLWVSPAATSLAGPHPALVR